MDGAADVEGAADGKGIRDWKGTRDEKGAVDDGPADDKGTAEAHQGTPYASQIRLAGSDILPIRNMLVECPCGRRAWSGSMQRRTWSG
ncbi:hypothetical protein [Nocardioides sp.]|uniref:hypothetical protein n=1 Tax=Nocardioides sp. TaxID=35761 RepID=UPI002F42D25C